MQEDEENKNQIGNYVPKEVEEKLLSFWNDNQIQKKANEINAKKQKYYFLDGPPYTSGKVHLGTAWNKSLKDAFIRYKRQKGFAIWDRAGYDMHGLPTENATQKKLNLKTKEDIAEFGITNFIEECRTLCMDNMKIMNKDFTRMGVWMDFKNAYQAASRDFMSGEWWLIKKAHEEGRLYEGLRTMTWCPITESSLAKHEIEYKNVIDKSIFVKFKIDKEKTDNKLVGENNSKTDNNKDEYLIIWTTTPWTIPFNLAVMAGPEIEYQKIEVDGEYWYVAKALANVFVSMVVKKEYKVIEEFTGDKLEGISYIHPFQTELAQHYDEIKGKAPKTHTVVMSKEHVDTTAGTGLVHCAPGCGPEDFEVGYKNKIPAFNTIDTKGKYPEDMGVLSGLVAKKDDKKFIEEIEKIGALVASTEIEHDYPHDWRHGQPVIFRTTKQWFFKIEDLKEEMIKNNNEVKWTPKAAYNAFDSWLKNLRDNSISKQRFWGTPIPVWRNIKDEKDIIVVGSAEELEELTGQKVNDLHIPTVDKIEIKRDGKIYKRVPDVLDVWVDAGTVSWNCLNFPKDKDNFDAHYPAEFILEGKDQIRGWFNLLWITSHIAIKKPAFKAVYMHGFVNDTSGRKMSKSLGNTISPYEVIDKFGADTMRYYMIGGANPGLDMNYNFDDITVKSRNLGILWNVHKYLIDLGKTTGINPSEAKIKDTDLPEKYILSRLSSTIKEVENLYDNFRVNEVPEKIEELYLELSRGYIQLVRDKITLGTKEEKETVLGVIYKVLFETAQMFATITPFIAEEIYQNFKNSFNLSEKINKESIHLMGWPVLDKTLINTKIENSFSVMRDIVSGTLYSREKAKLGVRWPLGKITLESHEKEIIKSAKYAENLIKTQTNIKEIIYVDDMGLKRTASPNFKKIREEYPSQIKDIIMQLKQIDLNEKFKLKDEIIIELDNINETITLSKEYFNFETQVPQNLFAAETKSGVVYLDITQNEELLAEGFLREIARRVQTVRKDAGLTRSDRIVLDLQVSDKVKIYLEPHLGELIKKVGADGIAFNEDELNNKTEFKIKEEKIIISIARVKI